MPDHPPDAGTYAAALRQEIGRDRPGHVRLTALPGHLARLASHGVAVTAHADQRDTAELLAEIQHGEGRKPGQTHSAEEALYSRVAADLDRVAGGAGGDTALSREDLHQEAAEKLITDARSGMINREFGGAVGPYLGRCVRRHLRDLADTQRVGTPTVPGRRRREMREALLSTSDQQGNYDVLRAVQYCRDKYKWTLGFFWTVYATMFGDAVSVSWTAEVGGGLALQDTVADGGSTDALGRVEIAHDVARLLALAPLSRGEREVIAATTGAGADGFVHSVTEAAERLGMTSRHARRLRASALAKLETTAAVLGIAYSN